MNRRLLILIAGLAVAPEGAAAPPRRDAQARTDMTKSSSARAPGWARDLKYDRDALPQGALVKFQLLQRDWPERNFRYILYPDGRIFLAGHSQERGGAFDVPLPTTPRRLGEAVVGEVKALLAGQALPPYGGAARPGSDSVYYVVTTPADGAARESIWHWRDGVTLPPLIERLARVRRDVDLLPERADAVPERLRAAFRVRAPLPPGTLLRLQVLGRGAHGGRNHVFELDSDGKVRYAEEQHDATSPPRAELALTGRVRGRLDPAALRRVEQALAEGRFTEQPPYLGHPGASDGTIWVLTARVRGVVHEVVYEVYRPPLIEEIERLLSAARS
jgi:hypothetical protein